MPSGIRVKICGLRDQAGLTSAVEPTAVEPTAQAAPDTRSALQKLADHFK